MNLWTNWAWLGLGGLYWSAQAVATELLVRRIPRLVEVKRPERTEWPRISLVMPARNEERHVAHALQSRLALGYPNLELVLVNDRSTDATGRVRWIRGASWTALLPFLGVTLLTYPVVRAAALSLLRGGVRWRDTFYPTAAVRAGRRVP